MTGRGLAWWPLAAVFVLAGFLNPQPAGVAPGNAASWAPRVSPLNALVAGILIVAGIGLLPFWRSVGPAGVPNGLLTYAPQGIAAHLGSAVGQCTKRVWHPQTWGSWLEFAVPCDTFTVDSRIELYPATVWTDYDTVENVEPGWQDVLTRWGVQVVVTNARTDAALDQALGTVTSWGRVYRDDDGSIWALAVPPRG